MFRIAPPLELKKLEAILQHKMLRMLLSKRKISEEMIRMHSAWRHSGFHVFCCNRISPTNDRAMENLTRCIIRASFSQDRSIWIRRGRPSILPKMAGQARTSPHGNGWPPCLRTFPTGASKWSGTMPGTAMSHGGNGRRKEPMTPFPPSSNRRGMKKSSVGIGRV